MGLPPSISCNHQKTNFPGGEALSSHVGFFHAMLIFSLTNIILSHSTDHARDDLTVHMGIELCNPS